MQWLARLCVRRPVFTAVLMLAISVVGTAGYFQLGLDQFPKIDFPAIVITTVLPGAAPEEVETEITDKIEAAVNTISGIDELRSASVEGVSQLFVTFTLDKDVNVAAQEVRDHVNTALASLPRGAGQVVVREVNDHPIRVADVARVEDGEEEEETAAFQNGKRTIILSIRKQSGENTVAVVDAVRDRLAGVEKALPAGYKLEIVRD